MYGADAIPVWTRLLGVIPEDYRQFIYLGNLICDRQFKLVALAYYAHHQATRAAISWGNFVKAAFDLFLGDLQQKLAITQDDNVKSDEVPLLLRDRIMWQQYSQAILYKKSDVMPSKSIPPPADETKD